MSQQGADSLNLNSVMMGSEDSKKLGDFYTKVLGPPNPDWSDADNGWFGFSAGDGSLAIGPHSEVKGRSEQPGRIMLNFETAEVKSEFERIKALGAEVVAEPYEPSGGEGMLMCTFADPDGNYFQLSTPWTPEPS
jgi:predicted enzyme related to lactoylglutathione lyase